LSGTDTDAADAKRYRWLRDRKAVFLGPVVGAQRYGSNEHGRRYLIGGNAIGSVAHDIDTLDAAIDLLMNPPKKKPRLK
jgi:hypothetical protein